MHSFVSCPAQFNFKGFLRADPEVQFFILEAHEVWYRYFQLLIILMGESQICAKDLRNHVISARALTTLVAAVADNFTYKRLLVF